LGHTAAAFGSRVGAKSETIWSSYGRRGLVAMRPEAVLPNMGWDGPARSDYRLAGLDAGPPLGPIRDATRDAACRSAVISASTALARVRPAMTHEAVFRTHVTLYAC
jgi:hypothetical protein